MTDTAETPRAPGKNKAKAAKPEVPEEETAETAQPAFAEPSSAGASSGPVTMEVLIDCVINGSSHSAGDQVDITDPQQASQLMLAGLAVTRADDARAQLVRDLLADPRTRGTSN